MIFDFIFTDETFFKYEYLKDFLVNGEYRFRDYVLPFRNANFTYDNTICGYEPTFVDDDACKEG